MGMRGITTILCIGKASQELEVPIHAKLSANPPFEIDPENKYRFSGKKVNVHITFEVDSGGNITELEADARGQLRHFNKK